MNFDHVSRISVLIVLFTILHIPGITAVNTYEFVGRNTVKTSQGTITGNEQKYTYEGTSYGVAEFLSIPYAEPPTGDLRFRKPVKLNKFSNNYANATIFGPSCMQNIDDTFKDTEKYSDKEREASFMWNVDTMDEDCLTINVWTPSPIMPAPLKPVMLWVYGGGYFSGGSQLEVYRGHRLAALEDVVVVSFNYRVGLLGFMCIDESIPGNMGLYDQRLAMQWVQEHISSFGGDPEAVTVFGESAGAASIGLHILSPYSKGLFSKAIMQSGSPLAPWAVMELAEMRQRSQIVATLIFKAGGCNKSETIPQCFRRLNPGAILILEATLWSAETERYLPFTVGPVIDGDMITDMPINNLKAGKFQKIPVLMGSNKNEGSFWLIYYIPNIFNDFIGDNPVTAEQYDEAMRNAFGRLPKLEYDAISFYYRNWSNVNNPVSNRQALDDSTGEQNFMCPVNHFAEYVSEESDLYMYFLTQRSSTESWPEWMGVIHGADCEWIFGKFLDHISSLASERQLNRQILNYWANFARNGNPNLVSSSNDWPRWTNETQATFVLDTAEKPKTILGPRSPRCAFWSNYIPSLRTYNDTKLDVSITPFSSAFTTTAQFFFMNFFVIFCMSFTRFLLL